MRILTIGGYRYSQSEFIAALLRAGVETLADIRQRRGVRGREHAFLNATRLQELLKAAGIRYVHIPNLAPTSEIRDQQKARDLASGVGKKDRRSLAPEFAHAYMRIIAAPYTKADFQHSVGDASAVALFCVETRPEACHRSIAASHIAEMFGVTVEHLLP